MGEIKSSQAHQGDLGAEIYNLHTVDALLKAAAALAQDQEMTDIRRICEVIRERLDVVRNNLDLIDIGRGAEVQHG